MITHSLIMAVVESYRMVERQIQYLGSILPANWEAIIVDDDSTPPILVENLPVNFRIIPSNSGRRLGEWTQKEAVNKAALLAEGEYLVKNDVDHFFSAEAIRIADQFRGDMMLFHRKAGILTGELTIEELSENVSSPVDDIFVIRKTLFADGYPVTRQYGKGGAAFWHLSRLPEAQPADGALIYVTPDVYENYHRIERIAAV